MNVSNACNTAIHTYDCPLPVNVHTALEGIHREQGGEREYL